MRKLFPLLLVFTSLNALSVGFVASTKVTNIVVQGQNWAGAHRVCILVADTIADTPSCNIKNRFCTDLALPFGDAALSAAFVARSSNADIEIAGLGTCNLVSNSEDLDYIKFLEN